MAVASRGARLRELILESDEEAYVRDPDHAMTHVLAHLDYHLGALGEEITAEQEEEADFIADIRLGREGTR